MDCPEASKHAPAADSLMPMNLCPEQLQATTILCVGKVGRAPMRTNPIDIVGSLALELQAAAV